MTIVKQKTVNGTTLVLKRKKDPVDSRRNIYEIHTASGEVVEEDAGSSKAAAMAEFNKAVDIFKSSASNNRKSDPFGPGLF